MGHEPRLERERLAAGVALESFLLGVDGEMLPHVGQLGAAVRTVGTDGRFLPGMRPHVLSKIGSIVESSLAHLALQRFHPLVLDDLQ